MAEIPKLPGDWDVTAKTHTSDMRVGPETYLVATRVDKPASPIKVKVELGSIYQEDDVPVALAFKEAWIEMYNQVMETEGKISKERRIADFVNKVNKGLWPAES